MEVTQKTLIENLKKHIASNAFQERLMGLLKKYDILRFRNKISDELNIFIQGHYSKWELSYNIHKVTNLATDQTDKIAIEIYNDLLKDKIKDINAIQISKNEAESESYKIRRPLELDDIFKEEHEDVDLVEMVDSAEELRQVTKAEEDKALDELLRKVTLTIADDQKKRLRDVARSRLKNIRDAVDTRLALSRSVETGGVGLRGIEASDMSMLIEDYIKTSWPPHDTSLFKKSSPSVKQEPADPKMSEDMLENTSESVPKLEKKQDKKIQFEDNLAKKLDEKKDKRPYGEERKAVLKEIDEKEREKKEFVPERPITKEPHLMGPLDELQEMSINDLRNLYSSPLEAKRKIKERIDVLGKDSFSKKIEGINMWRKGNIMQLYLNIGEKSIQEKKSIEEVIEEQKANNKPYLTNEEFQAIMELNKELRTLA